MQARSAIKGPFYIVLDNLQSASLANSDGETETAPGGSPYVKLNKKSLRKGQKLRAKLEFEIAPGGKKVTYTPRVLAGRGVP